MNPGKVMGLVITILFFTSVAGTIFTATSNPNENITGASLVLYGLIGLVLVAGFLMYLYKQSGMGGR